ncbi:MAG: hypothetical protein IJ174_05545, partial [Clostridia bacterium]|nr:hypothetical protein [Clostridia bacterium]
MNWNAKLKRIMVVLLVFVMVLQVSPMDAENGSGSLTFYSDWLSPEPAMPTFEYTFMGTGDTILLPYLLALNGGFGNIVDVTVNSPAIEVNGNLYLTAVGFFDRAVMTVTTDRAV